MIIYNIQKMQNKFDKVNPIMKKVFELNALKQNLLFTKNELKKYNKFNEDRE